MVCGDLPQFDCEFLFRRTTFAAGNRINSTSSSSSSATTWITGTDNEMLYDGTYNYNYDADGNRTTRWIAQNSSETAPVSGDSDITVYVWDYHDRLTGEESKGQE
jgi:hypothetical protein